ncbi:hydroxysteroid 11-beta-dehydrogenase 1-like protein isoform X2 [Hippopotamus amphibius kiboko]|nr:hydroxysteroid 11-beta-dehydrogenase 1-like protein isoform X2 [Hippopotamus amphibius kiboko]XP_057565687.1 hydroxysteroid 11-beta-dehydrogenase 1-like protein isoform X2 [Hippopotamus amphibius kiboko]XP_057565688.1 hydroxysteroid 11-beta-dehydrogenase 1-like protein isoform X2 [Hippopotamus amphibius kiboko]XP_057565689.1 hydroxysteroid 11-beta-dehydrogenase 1-like protein isoform X2 [Hippopotamus amphibius kiboko]XP_057565690.1 hydroxysteroid 11-beta-dehydrogenase 1-like protein isoform 
MKVLLLTGLGALFFAYYWDDNFDPASLQGARVLLTGASAGVGEELAYHYARLGSHLVLTAHTEALLQKVVGNCRKLGAPKVFYIAADMAAPEVPERVVQFALDKLGGLDYLVLNHLGAAPAGTRARSAQGTRWLMQAPPSWPWLIPWLMLRLWNSAPVLEPRHYQPRPRPQALGSAPAPSGLGFLLRPVTRSRHLQVNFLSYVQLTSLALPSLTDSKGSLVVVSSLLGRVPTSFSSPYSAAKFALDSFFGSLRRELGVQDVNVAITMCVLGLRDRASAAEGVRGVTRAKAAPGPKAALAVIRGGATRASGVFYPWRFHLLCLLRGWMPHPRAWFIRQELNITTPAAA